MAKVDLEENRLGRLEQSEGGLEFWCHSCKAPLFISWGELDQLRAEGADRRVLCRCRRWIGNINARSRISLASVL